jgi:hypothetical protein
MKWKYFCGACLVVGAALFKAGAPIFAILAGIAFAGVTNYLRQRAPRAPRAEQSRRSVAKAR